MQERERGTSNIDIAANGVGFEAIEKELAGTGRDSAQGSAIELKRADGCGCGVRKTGAGVQLGSSSYRDVFCGGERGAGGGGDHLFRAGDRFTAFVVCGGVEGE